MRAVRSSCFSGPERRSLEVEKLPVDLAKTDLVAVLVFVLAWIAQKKKTGTITLLFSSGVAGLLFYLVTGTHP